jgi:hypothetical protein
MSQKVKKSKDWLEIANKHEEFCAELKTYTLHEVVSHWLMENTQNVDVPKFSDEILDFVENEIDNYKVNERKDYQLNKEFQ